MGDTLVEDDSPDRCQFSNDKIQCSYARIPMNGKMSLYCGLHNKTGVGGLAYSNQQTKLKRYRLTQHFARVSEIAGDQDFKDMREEVAIQRLLVEEVMNSCKTPFDLLCNSQRISDLVQKVQKSVAQVHKLEVAMGQVLDKQTLLTFVDSMVRIISEEVHDEQVLKVISERMAALIKKTEGTTGNNDAQSTQ